MSEADDPRAVMWESVQSLRSIKTCLSENPNKEMCKQMAETMGTILGKLESQISLLDNYRRAENEQVSVPQKKKMTETVQEKKSRSGFFSYFKKSKTKIQILNPTRTQTTDTFSLALKNQMSDADCTLISKNDPLDQQMPLIVVCQNSTRLKPDVDLTLETVKWPLQCVVIILHVGAESNLPAIPTANKLKGYNNVIFVDMGFSYHGDILNCHHNKEAENMLYSYIAEFYKM